MNGLQSATDVDGASTTLHVDSIHLAGKMELLLIQSGLPEGGCDAVDG